MLKIVIPDNEVKIKQQIKALQWQIQHDNPKDKQIHIQALQELKKAKNTK